MGTIIAAAFLAGAIFAGVIMYLAKERICDDDPMDEAEANIPRNCPGCDCGSSMDSSDGADECATAIRNNTGE